MLVAGCNDNRAGSEKIEEPASYIVVLAYGSLIQQPVNPTNNIRLAISGSWLPFPITLPVSLTRLSSQNRPTERATRVIDSLFGTHVSPWYAASKFSTLLEAMENLAGREGAPRINNSYKLDNIFYMRKLGKNEALEPNEQTIPDAEGFVMKAAGQVRQKLPDETLSDLAHWAKKNGSKAIVWASFPPNRSSDEIKARLKQKPDTLKNTKAYINNLPPEMKRTPFELEILEMPGP